ncbi:hypothetical protein McanMca71_001998 [Microsporum canis]
MKFNLVLLATFLAAPILATTIPEVSEAIDLADREMSAVDEGNELTARKMLWEMLQERMPLHEAGESVSMQ